MYRTNINDTDECKTWYSSDFHLGHRREFIWESRGYKSPEDHTDSIISTVNDYVKENDILFNLGDLCLNTTPEEIENYLSRIVCKNIWCLFGNHNNPHEKTIYRPVRDKCTPENIHWAFPLTYKNLTYIGHYNEIIVNGQFIVMCHYPLRSWNHLSDGSWCLCGHEHGALEETRPEYSEGKILDLAWDLYKKPISFSEIQTIMNSKKMSAVGHHVKRVPYSP